jgi:hypothetical protein
MLLTGRRLSVAGEPGLITEASIIAPTCHLANEPELVVEPNLPQNGHTRYILEADRLIRDVLICSREPGYRRNLGSCAESAIGEQQDVFINGRETRRLGHGSTRNR